jgi:parallel beta-helix repeat protein
MCGIEIRDCSVNVTDMQRVQDDHAEVLLSDDDDAPDNSSINVDDTAHAEACTAAGFICGGPEGTVRGVIIKCRVQRCQIGILTRDACAIGVHACRVSGCIDAGIVSRDASSSIIKSCIVSNSGIGIVLQGISGGRVEDVRVDACAVGLLVHRMGVGAVEEVEARCCAKGLVVAKGGGGLTFRGMRVDGGSCGVVVGSVCCLSQFRVRNCSDEGFLVERSGHLVLQVMRRKVAVFLRALQWDFRIALLLLAVLVAM